LPFEPVPWRDILIRSLIYTPAGQVVLGVVGTGVIFFLWMQDPTPEGLLLLGFKTVVIVLALRDPFIPCLLFLIFSHFRIHEAFSFLYELRIPQFLAIVTLGSLVWHLLFMRSIKPFWSNELALLGIFFMIVTFGIVFAVDRAASVGYWTGTFVKIIIMSVAIAWATRTPAQFAMAARFLILAGSAVALVAIYNKIEGIGLVEGTRVTISRQIGSMLGDPNDLALALLFALGFAGAFLLSKLGTWDRLLGLAGTLVVLFGIIATQSRGGLLGVLGVMVVLAASRIRSKLVIFGGIAVVGLALFSAAAISNRQVGGSDQGVDESTEGRLIAWETAWNMAKARPLTGVGVTNSVESFYFYTPRWQGNNKAVHSTWLGVLAETGFPGFFLFVMMVIAVTRASLASLRYFRAPDANPRMRATSLALVASLVGFCVSGTFLTQGLNWPFYILLGLTVAMRRERETEAIVVEPPAPAVPKPAPRLVWKHPALDRRNVGT
jgi:probable O-glycosylation ligase (exosortase A-associated)